MTHTFNDAVEAVRERMEYIKPTTEVEATDAATEAFSEYIDGALTYYSDVLELWDGNTRDDVEMECHDDIMSAITASTYFQLSEEWADAIYDGIDAYIDANLEHPDRDNLDRDDALEIINGSDMPCDDDGDYNSAGALYCTVHNSWH